MYCFMEGAGKRFYGGTVKKPTKLVRAPWQKVLFDDGVTLTVLCELAGEGGVWRRLGAQEHASQEEPIHHVAVSMHVPRRALPTPLR